MVLWEAGRDSHFLGVCLCFLFTHGKAWLAEEKQEEKGRAGRSVLSSHLTHLALPHPRCAYQQHGFSRLRLKGGQERLLTFSDPGPSLPCSFGRSHREEGATPPTSLQTSEPFTRTRTYLKFWSIPSSQLSFPLFAFPG